MHLIKRIAIAIAIILVVAVAFLWWNQPQKTDMSANAPADSLVYLEANSLTNVSAAIVHTDAWTKLNSVLERPAVFPAPWLLAFSRWTGIGPIEAVVASRAQIAVVMLDVAAKEEGETLRVRPEAAVLIETHTSKRRIAGFVEQTLKKLAEGAYGTPDFKKTNAEGVEYLIWSAPSGTRQIVATIADSLVIVGNNVTTVNACLMVRQGKSANLSENPELKLMRARLSANQALSFGFVSSTNAARLTTLAMPIFLGRAESDAGISKLVSGAAAKIIGSVGWVASAAGGGIEDRYFISIQRPVLTRLRPAFGSPRSKNSNLLLPASPHSISVYHFDDPQMAWEGFESAILSQLDALSAAIFTSLFKSALTPYGIEDPKAFLALVGPELATVRLTSASERSLVVTEVRDAVSLQRLLGEKFKKHSQKETASESEILESADGELAAYIADGKLYLGDPQDVRTCIQSLTSGQAHRVTDNKRMSNSPTAPIGTYSDDSERVRGFVLAIGRATGVKDTGFRNNKVEEMIATLPYSYTETAIGEEGLERRTRSPFGQFGALTTVSFPGDR